MMGIPEFFMVVATATPFILFLWWVVSSINRMTRGIEDIAATLRRMEQKERQP